MDSLNRILPALIIIAFLISLIIAVFYSRYVTNPILVLSRASKKLADLDFQIQRPVNRSDEIGILGENLNRLAEGLEEALDELKKKTCCCSGTLCVRSKWSSSSWISFLQFHMN